MYYVMSGVRPKGERVCHPGKVVLEMYVQFGAF